MDGGIPHLVSAALVCGCSLSLLREITVIQREIAGAE
jgi:hypothetical protein